MMKKLVLSAAFVLCMQAPAYAFLDNLIDSVAGNTGVGSVAGKTAKKYLGSSLEKQKEKIEQLTSGETKKDREARLTREADEAEKARKAVEAEREALAKKAEKDFQASIAPTTNTPATNTSATNTDYEDYQEFKKFQAMKKSQPKK